VTADEAFQILLGVFLVAWVILEWLTIWARRPWDVFDPYENRWRAERGMENKHGTRTRPPTQRAVRVEDRDQVRRNLEERNLHRPVDSVAS
jgi:hypothetical protein